MIFTCISVSIVTFAFLVYHFFFDTKDATHSFKKRHEPNRTNFHGVILKRLAGFLLFGGLPLAAIFLFFENPLNDFGFRQNPGLDSLLWIVVLSVVIVTMNFFNAPKKQNLAMYPQIRMPVWSPLTLTISAITWIAYLLGYEFMFRGFLLFALFDEMGVIPAIIINTAIYSLVHIPKGKIEALGAIPLGILLCYLTLESGNILIAFTVHVIMALTNEWFSLRVHPEMKVVRK